MILSLADGNKLKAYDIVERQLAVLVLRTQVMLSLSGIVITVTGFSGKAIAQTSDVARFCIAGGILVVLLAAAAAIGGVLRVSWLTQSLDEDPLEMLLKGLALRDKKSQFLRLSLVLFIAGFSLYCVAIAQLLMAAR